MFTSSNWGVNLTALNDSSLPSHMLPSGNFSNESVDLTALNESDTYEASESSTPFFSGESVNLAALNKYIRTVARDQWRVSKENCNTTYDARANEGDPMVYNIGGDKDRHSTLFFKSILFENSVLTINDILFYP